LDILQEALSSKKERASNKKKREKGRYPGGEEKMRRMEMTREKASKSSANESYVLQIGFLLDAPKRGKNIESNQLRPSSIVGKGDKAGHLKSVG